MKTNIQRTCPRCGTAIGTGSLQGLCPSCLALVAFEEDSAVTQRPAERVMPAITLVLDSSASAAKPLISAAVRYFGDYELLEEIARGGMGVVFKARQVSLNRTVALKMILAGKFATDTDVKRFHTEAEAAANLQHPNIVAIHEVGLHEGRHYFSMDYVEGKNLADFTKVTPTTATHATRLIQSIAEAIHYAHQRGTLHRDLKPHNVLIDAAGQPRITDFGLAKLTKQDTSTTRTDEVMGSPGYMPPEQAAGQNELVGPSSDVYAIGAMLYHLMTGRAPFVAETALATLREVMEEEPLPPSKLNPMTPRDLETICLKCLEKRPERRYASARELGEELGRFLDHQPIHARPASVLRKFWSWLVHHPWLITGAAALSTVVLVGITYGLWQQNTYLTWEKTHPVIVRELGPLVGRLSVAIGAGLFLLLPIMATVVMAFQRHSKQRRLNGSPIRRDLLLAYGALGVAGILVGIDIVLRTIDAHVWEGFSLFRFAPEPGIFSLPWSDRFWVLVMGTLLPLWMVIAMLVPIWLGALMVWTAIREHEFGAFGSDPGGPKTNHFGFTEDGLISTRLSSRGLLALSIAATLLPVLTFAQQPGLPLYHPVAGAIMWSVGFFWAFSRVVKRVFQLVTGFVLLFFLLLFCDTHFHFPAPLKTVMEIGMEIACLTLSGIGFAVLLRRNRERAKPLVDPVSHPSANR